MVSGSRSYKCDSYWKQPIKLMKSVTSLVLQRKKMSLLKSAFFYVERRLMKPQAPVAVEEIFDKRNYRPETLKNHSDSDWSNF